MDFNSTDRHNELAPRLMRELVSGTLGAGDGATEMLVVLTSVAFGCIELAAQLGGDEDRGRTAYLHAFIEQLSERVEAHRTPGTLRKPPFSHG